MVYKPTYKTIGVQAILIEWQPQISREILDDILSFKEKLALQKNAQFLDFIVAYNSLTIIYKDEIVNANKAIKELQDLYENQVQIQKTKPFIWQIPVCYDIEFGLDLKIISEKVKLPINQIINLHSQTIYTVYFIGFLPGFLYLGGLNPQLFLERRANPRLKVAKGSVGIGGKQTGIYPSETAGGWHLIGKTPINFFDVSKEPPCFAKSGDGIQFQSVSKAAFYDIEKSVLANTYQIIKTPKND